MNGAPLARDAAASTGPLGMVACSLRRNAKTEIHLCHFARPSSQIRHISIKDNAAIGRRLSSAKHASLKFGGIAMIAQPLRHRDHFWFISLLAFAASMALALMQSPARGDDLVKHPTFYRTTKVDGLSIFYREAGPSDAPTLLLLHGFPSSSRMFEPLFARLSDRYHLVAPDYPGFGHSDWPDPKAFNYTFDHIASVMNDFTQSMGLSHYTLYMQDYGGPVGFRVALAYPERVDALIVQDAVAHNEGLGELWKPRRAFWADRAAHEGAFRANFLSLATTRARHAGDDPNPEPYDPDLWTDELAFLSQPGQADIQTDLFYDYRTNVDAYPKWQAWMREKQPRLLVIWGKHDLSFDLGEPERYRKDVADAQIHVLDASHFALDTKADEIAALVHDFMNGQK
jgi:pimeloyl-ACP methyl ester carboxylesterase